MKLIDSAPGEQVTTASQTSDQAHAAWLSGATTGGYVYPRLLFRPSSVDYTGTVATALTPTTVSNDPQVWRTGAFSNEPFAQLPSTAAGTAYRTITSFMAQPGAPVQLSIQGQYDPKKLTEQSATAQVPMETYQAPSAVGADAMYRKILGGQALLPDANPAGYLQSPPMLITSLRSLSGFSNPANFIQPADDQLALKPISAIRIRVADANTGTAAGRERIRLVAEQIQQRTGLQVDITAGSSPAPTTVNLAASRLGQPALQLSEPWSKKGVAAQITDAIDRKSVLLLGLILASTILAIAMSATASVRARRTELGVLSCIGWRPRTIVNEVLGEQLITGVVAGLLGAAAAVPVADALSLTNPGWRALIAVPAAVAVVVVAGVVPAWLAARSVPAEAVRPAVRDHSRWRIPLHGTASMALSYLQRTPGRVLAAACCLGLGVTSLGLLLGVLAMFQGAVVGTLLGDAVTVQVHGPDIIAASVLAIIGLATLADVLYLDLREQAPRYASLKAVGWRDSTLRNLIAWQAAIIGTIGSALGGLVALAGLTLLGGLNTTGLISVGLVMLAAIIAAILISLLPARRMRHLPMARLLSED